MLGLMLWAFRWAKTVTDFSLRASGLVAAGGDSLDEELHEFAPLPISLWGIFLDLRDALAERQEPRLDVLGGQPVILPRGKVGLN